jgi:thiol-disulfide isomerase/thioredoxin
MDGMKVITLTEDNVKDFATKMPSHGLVFIAFLAPWCGHCQTFKPEWNQIQEHITQNKDKGSGHIITVDDTNMKHLPCKQPSGFPTLSLYNGNEWKENYSGPRSKDALVQYLMDTMVKQNKPKKQKKRTKKRTKKRKRKHSSINGGGRTYKRRRHSLRSSKRCKRCKCKRCKCR